MAFLHARIYVARPKEETAPVGVKEYDREASPYIEITTGNEPGPGGAAGVIIGALDDTYFAKFRPSDNLINSVLAAYFSGTHQASTGTWSTRYGKHIYAWGVGYGSSQQDAKNNVVYYDLT